MMAAPQLARQRETEYYTKRETSCQEQVLRPLLGPGRAEPSQAGELRVTVARESPTCSHGSGCDAATFALSVRSRYRILVIVVVLI